MLFRILLWFFFVVFTTYSYTNAQNCLPEIQWKLKKLYGGSENLINTDIHTFISREENIKKIYRLDLSKYDRKEKENINLSNLKYLHELILPEVSSLPQGIKNLKCLKELSLSSSINLSLSSSFDKLAQLPELEVLNLSNCNISTIPTEITRLEKLRELYLSRNPNLQGKNLTDAINLLSELKYLEVLHLDENQLKFLPEVITKLPNLKYLSLENNDIKQISQKLIDYFKASNVTVNNDFVEKLVEDNTENEKVESNTNTLRSLKFSPKEVNEVKKYKAIQSKDSLQSAIDTLLLAKRNIESLRDKIQNSLDSLEKEKDKSENEIFNLEQKQDRNLLITTICVIISIIFIVAFFVVYRDRQRQKISEINRRKYDLEKEKNKEIENKNIELRNKYNELEVKDIEIVKTNLELEQTVLALKNSYDSLEMAKIKIEAKNHELEKKHEELEQASIKNKELFEDFYKRGIDIEIQSNLLKEQKLELAEKNEELITQQNSLTLAYAELEEKNKTLQEQKEELDITNTQLEESTEELYVINAQLEERTEELYVINTQLEERTLELEKLQKFKDKHIHMLIHDFKNPLTNINTLSQNYHSKPLENLYRDFENIAKSAKQIESLRSFILDIQRMENGEVTPKLSSENIAGLIDKVAQYFWAEFERKNITFKRNIPYHINALMDISFIHRTLDNLIGNAIKHSEGREISVSATLLEEEKKIKIKVSDTGDGISEDKKPYIFKEFHSFDNSTGLGLTFCKLAIELHGSKIDFESEEGKGTAFYFNLPLAIENRDNASYFNQVIINNSSITSLSQEEKKYLHAYASKLKIIKQDSISEVMDILESIPNTGNEAIEKWKEEVRTSSFKDLEKTYHDLLDMVLVENKS